MTPAPNKAAFLAALRLMWLRAQEDGANHVDVVSGDLHRLVGGYPGQNHRMPMCCDVMYAAKQSGDRILSAPPKGKGASLTIRYLLPRGAGWAGEYGAGRGVAAPAVRIGADSTDDVSASAANSHLDRDGGHGDPVPVIRLQTGQSRLPSRGARPVAERAGRVGLVGCVKKKQSRPAPAGDLYTSPLFRGRRAYVERTCERWLILSALHGVVRPDAVLEPYDVTLNDASPAERRSWATRVLRQLDAELGSCAGLTFEVHAGSNYADYGLENGLRARSAAVDRPTAGLSMGRQLSFYADADRDAADVCGINEPAPDEAAPLPSAPEWDERDAWSAIADLDESPELVRIRDWPGDLACLDRPGLYAWWVDEAGATALTRGLGMQVGAGRIYAGQAGATKWPSGKAGNNTLGKRIGQMHLGGKVRMSTFRWTLASILFEELGVQVQASMLISPASEEALSEWMRAHLSVAVHPHDDRDTLDGLERELLGLLDPPLNLRHMAVTPLRVRLTDLRRRISREP